MDYIYILAKTAENEASKKAAEKGIIHIDKLSEQIWGQITSLDLVGALTFIAFGFVCLFYGWRVFKVLVTICFALFGMVVAVLANKYIEGHVVWLALVCVILFGALSIPLMRYGVMVLGAAAGGIITGGGWLAAGLPEQYIWAGAGGNYRRWADFIYCFQNRRYAVHLSWRQQPDSRWISCHFV